MKRIILLCVAMLLISSTAMAAGGKIAYVDTQAVFDRAKLGKKYQGVVREYYESRKKILDLDSEDIQKLQDDYTKQKQAKLLNEKAEKEKEETLNRKISEFQKKRDDFSGEIGKKNEELSSEFNQQLVLVLKDIAKREKYSLVLNKTINILSKAEVPAVLYAEEDLDLTERVVAELDKKEDAKKEETKK
ncbi:MAG: OmpH family outer membrane protein [Nitrospirae bacterium]|nr:OmpH family outer membrane protein [Nitrospirota bacterium]